MEKVIIQISDLHLFCNQKTKKVDIKCFVDCMKRFFNIDAEYYLVVCGDLTMDGTQNNCSFSLRLLEEIKRNIESCIKKQLNILIVPGNHDINLTKSNIDFRKLAELENEGNISGIEKLFISEANNEKHFLSICKQFGCFKDSYSIDFINNADLNFVLINTSVFSSKIKEDKEHHHILTSEDFPFKTELNENGITLLVQHHRNDWLNYDSSQRIDEFAKKNVSICLYGHEHIGKDTIVKENDYPEILFIQSGEMKIRSNRLVGSFNILKIDKDNNYCDIFRYNYDKNNEMFIPDNAEGKLKIHLIMFLVFLLL